MRRNRGRGAWLVIALTFAVAAAALMTLHTVRHAIRIHHASEAVRPWMNIPYIARSRHVPAEKLYEALGLPPAVRDHRPLGRIARQQGRPVRDVIGAVEAAIAKAHGRAGPPHAEPPHGTAP
jgi:hypothetical protein